jgi:hypothetical protein
MNGVIFVIGAGVVVGTALWVAVDAARNRIPTYGDRYDLNTGAFTWFLGCMLLWIFVFPAYWVRRASVLRQRGVQPSLEDENRALKEELRQLKERPADTGAFREGTAVGAREAQDAGLAEHVTESPPVARVAGQGHDADVEPLDVRIKSGPGNDTCVVVALILPAVAAVVGLVSHTEAIALEWALGLGTVLMTAILLAIDAAALGRVDAKGGDRVGAGSIFAGVLLLWIVFYPAAFFRRRHFGKPNLGALAILVAVVFVGAPLARDAINLGTLLSGDPPACTSPEVTQLVETLIRKNNPLVPINRIDGFKETRFDRNAMIRHGQCMVHQPNGVLAVVYQVRWIDRTRGQFGVVIEPANPPGPNPGQK